MKLTSDQHITKAEGRSSDVLEDHHYRSHLPIERPSQRPLLDRIDLDRKQLRGISVRLGVFGDVLRRLNTSPLLHSPWIPSHYCYRPSM